MFGEELNSQFRLQLSYLLIHYRFQQNKVFNLHSDFILIIQINTILHLHFHGPLKTTKNLCNNYNKGLKKNQKCILVKRH